MQSHTSRTSGAKLSSIARIAVGLEIFIGIGALFGGGQFILARDGHIIGMPTTPLAGSPFQDYLVPGIILFVCIGVGPLVAAALTLRRHPLAPLAAFAVGATLIGWITVEMLILAGPASIAWAIYLVLGSATAAVAVVWWRSASVDRPARAKPLAVALPDLSRTRL